MGIVDFNLLKQVISDLEKQAAESSPITDEEKIIATEQIYKDYQDGKSKMPEYRQKVIEGQIWLSKRMYKDRYQSFIDKIDEDIEMINRYQDDYVYLLYMISYTAQIETEQRLKVMKLGNELMTLSGNVEKGKNPDTSLSQFTDLISQVEKKGAEIDETVRRIHVSKIMHEYYQKVSQIYQSGDRSLLFKP